MVMKDLLEVIVKGLVDNKDAISIEEKITNDTIHLSVKVDQNDMGQLIGKQGKMAKSIRTVMKSVASKEHKRVNIEFVG